MSLRYRRGIAPPLTGVAYVRPSRACATRCAAGLACGTPRLPGGMSELPESALLPPPVAAFDRAAAAPPALVEALASRRRFAPVSLAAPGNLRGRAAARAWSRAAELSRQRLLMSISCSRLFTFTSWLMYSLGSVSAVGSWFCISVTSSVRKSLAEIVAESLLLVSLVLFCRWRPSWSCPSALPPPQPAPAPPSSHDSKFLPLPPSSLPALLQSFAVLSCLSPAHLPATAFTPSRRYALRAILQQKRPHQVRRFRSPQAPADSQPSADSAASFH